MKNRRNKTAIMIIGTLTALVVVFSQLFYFECSDLCKKQIKTETHDPDTPDHDDYALFSVPSSSVLSTIQIELNNEMFFLFEIFFEENEEASVNLDIPFSLGKYFLTLFPLIISPNAP